MIYLTFALAKVTKKGTATFPSLFSMSIESQVQAIEKMLENILANDPSYFIVEVKIRPTSNVKVFLDGDNGISIEKCVFYNRILYKKIEESGMFPDGDFSLEISSPGLEEPLKLLRQYRKNIGRKVEVLLKDGVKVEGKMIEVFDGHIIVEETRGKNKKQEIIQHNFSFDNIKSTKIQIVFKN
jgi:ribosome maturation factor RimP